MESNNNEPKVAQTPINCSSNALNPFTYSPSTTHRSLLVTNQKITPAKKVNQSIFKQPYPYRDHHQHHQKQNQPQQSAFIPPPFFQLSKVKENLNKKFSNQEGINLIITKEDQKGTRNKDDDDDSNEPEHFELISNSNSQSSGNEERALIENLTQREYSFSKRSRTQSSKKLSYEGTIELTNDHTGGIDLFKSFKEKDIWLKPINDHLLLNEEEDECDCSDEEVLTQSTQCVIKELCEGINQLNNDLSSQVKQSRLLSRDLY